MNEITKNIDGYRISTFINVDIDKKIKMGPIWDFNLALEMLITVMVQIHKDGCITSTLFVLVIRFKSLFGGEG